MKADLHIHTVLSPCGDVEMSPGNIVRLAKERGLGIIGITDHNSTRQCSVVAQLGTHEGLFVMCGAEVATAEEVHLLVFVDGAERLSALQAYLDGSLPDIANDPEVFGYQLVVDGEENVVYEEERLLISALDKSLDEVTEFVRSLEGIVIPAHIDKPANSLLSQLGFIPPYLDADAMEVSPGGDSGQLQNTYVTLEDYTLTRSSDAHYPDDIGRAYTELDVDTPSFEAVREALKRLRR